MNLQDVIEIAREIESEDPIDWGYLNISEEDAYKLIGMSVLEMYYDWKKSEHPDLIMISTLVKLIVENFVLNIKLQEIRRSNE